VERADERVVEFRPVDGMEFFRQFRAIMKAASIAMSP
jgi:hypothetical protein